MVTHLLLPAAIWAALPIPVSAMVAIKPPWAIPPVFKKCGVKTGEKYYENKELFQKKLETDNDAITQLETNTKVIDFKYIPSEYLYEFKNTYNLN